MRKGVFMKKGVLTAGIISGALYFCTAAFYVYKLIERAKFCLSLLYEHADYSLFTAKTYFLTYLPFGVYLLFCLGLVLFLLFYFISLFRSSYRKTRYAVIALIACLASPVLYQLLNSWICGLAIPLHWIIEGFLPILWFPAALPMAAFLIFIIVKRKSIGAVAPSDD